MNGTFALALAELLQLELRRTALNINLRAVVTIAALFTFKPNIFTLCRLGHKNLAKTKHTPTAAASSEEVKKTP
jgi:hypothetical protein